MTPNELEEKRELSEAVKNLSLAMEYTANLVNTVYGENSASNGLRVMSIEVLNIHNEIEQEILTKIESYE